MNWTDSDIEALRNYYALTPLGAFDASEIAKRLHRSVNAIYCKAPRIGASTQKGRPASLATRMKMSAFQKVETNRPERRTLAKNTIKATIMRRGHWRGMSGKTHSAKTRSIISEHSKSRWQDPESFLNSKLYRQQLSDRAIAVGLGGLHSTHTRAHGGRRVDLDNRFYRSSWEANYARYLIFLKAHGKIVKWEYESETFWFHKIKRGTRSYTPDFKVWENEFDPPCYHEIKGWMDNRSATKLKRMKKYYPEVRIILVDQYAYKAIAKSIKSLIPNWE